MEATYCVCVLANLEGLNNYLSREESSLAPTLAALDTRTQKLEDATLGLLPPPPVTPLTWSSLAWRVARLSANNSRFVSVLQSAPEVPLSASLDLLDNIVASLNNKFPGALLVKGDAKRSLPTDEGDADDEKTVYDDKDADEKRLDVLRQRLCYAIGKRGKKIDCVPYSLPATCSLALYLSLDVEKSGALASRPPGWNARGMAPDPPRPTRTIEITRPCRRKCCRRGRPRKGASLGSRIGGLFRKLAWWKGKKDAGCDSDSDSSSGSDTANSTGSSIVDR